MPDPTFLFAYARTKNLTTPNLMATDLHEGQDWGNYSHRVENTT